MCNARAVWPSNVCCLDVHVRVCCSGVVMSTLLGVIQQRRKSTRTIVGEPVRAAGPTREVCDTHRLSLHFNIHGTGTIERNATT